MIPFDMGKVFPIRLLGFGFYWAWLFLVTVSPSPLFGRVSIMGFPNELLELITRLAFVLTFYAMSTHLETPRGRTALVMIACVGGPLATGLAFYAPNSTISVVALIVEGLVDASTFVLWLCFFGHMKVGETALYMAFSYLIGGLLCIGIQAIGGELSVLIALFLPTTSGLMFLFSNKLYARKADSAELFHPTNTMIVAQTGVTKPYLTRLGLALICAAFVFGTCSCSLYFGAIGSLASGAIIESLDCLIIGIGCFVIMYVTKQTKDLCILYKSTPTMMILGIVLLNIPDDIVSTIGVTFVILGYLVFEITALNDFCIATKTYRLSLMKTFCMARIAITCGLVLGWVVFLSLHAFGAADHFSVCIGAAAVVMTLSSSVVFTEKEIYSARSVAESQERIERSGSEREDIESITEKQLESFAETYQLSTREAEISRHLVRGRNINYIAEQLYIAPGTVKTHIHNIYTKVGVHNKMELLDAFETMEFGT